MNGVTAVGVFFGGRSVEHEVSVVTAQQVMAALEGSSLRPVPVYIAKTGRWYSGDPLRHLDRFADVDRLLGDVTEVVLSPSPQSPWRLQPASGNRGGWFGRGAGGDAIDVAMPLVHGSHGEDGTLQGLFELCDLPYTGCGVTSSALCMDKPTAKAVLRDAGLPVLEHALVERESWQRARDDVLRSLHAELRYPMFVKPCTLGSSIGVSRAQDDDTLRDAVELALVYDLRCLVEPAQEGAVDINCAVLGDSSGVRVSVCEQPVSGGLLSYADKYLSKGGGKAAAGAGMKGAARIIPAPLTDSLTARVQEAAVAAFRALGASGNVRVDFLVHAAEERFIVNEVNTIPGSLAFYLWEPCGLSFPDLVRTLVEIARRRHEAKRSTVFSIDTWLLRGRPG